MKKTLIFVFLFLASYSFSATVPSPGGSGKISPTLPSKIRVKVPTPANYNPSNIKSPFPTNKFFNSVIYNLYNSYSLKMYMYPQVFECNAQTDQSRGLLIAYPETKYYENIINYGSGEGSSTPADSYANKIKVSAYKSIAANDYINCESAKLDDCSDFSATIKWEDASDNSKWMKATIGQGFVFSYFEISNNVFPALEVPYNWTHGASGNYYHLYIDTSTEIGNYSTLCESDRVLIRFYCGGKDTFYGVFAPKGTRFCQVNTGDNRHRIFLDMSNVSGNRYFSIALLPAQSLDQAGKDFNECYKYAYNFVSKTNVKWSVKNNSSSIFTTTEFNIATTRKRNDISQNDGTIFCLFPHQYKNIYNEPKLYATKTFADTLRGNLKIYSGSSFSTKVKFNGIVPFFNYNISSQAKTVIVDSLNTDKNININNVSQENTYYYGKNLAKVANLIPVSDNLKSNKIKRELIAKLKTELITWFKYTTGQQKKYFAYDSVWGGLMGIGDPNVDSFGTERYNDHNFHYGYYIYASAILSMYDEDFKNNYGGMVELLIKDFANTTKNDPSFPYMRSFDFYESHTWANGMGGADNRGIDIESSSEAMNAWAAIYMWGLATQKQEYIDLGIYLYANEYEAIKNYFFDIGDEKNILKNAYNHISLGILFAGSASYDELWWKDWVKYGARQYQGIQLLPMTASMLYVGYDSSYAQSFYNEDNFAWNDIWTRFLSIFNDNAQTAWTTFYNNHDGENYIDDGGTASYTYHFIDFFRQNGSLQTGYSSNIPSYLVTKKSDGTIVYSAYNYTDSVKKVDFYKGSEYLGYINVYAKTFMSTEKLLNGNKETKLSVFPVPYKPGNSSKYGGEGINFLGIQNGANIKIFNIAGEKVFDKTVSADNGVFIWNAKNNSGNNVASGIYIYIVDSNGKKTKGKLAIER